MIIGVPKEIKTYEFRVAMTPAMVRCAVDAGHKVLVEKGAGEKVSFSDTQYTTAGAEVLSDTAALWAQAEMIVKVKEPQLPEFLLMREGQIVFSYLHLAACPEVCQAMLDQGVVGIAYETVTDVSGRLPLLQPMSEIAGRVSVQAGATALQMAHGGRGVLLGGVPGVSPANVVVIGGGIVGTEAARMAMGLGANVTILDNNIQRLRELDALFGPLLKTLHSSPATVEEKVADADLVVGAVLLPGKRAPKLVTNAMVKTMLPGAVIADVSIDQGGCVEGVHPTTHKEPTFIKDGVVHYCVSNIPAACARTATLALTNATKDHILTLANKGYKKALAEDDGLREGLNTYFGKVTNFPVAEDLGHKYYPPKIVLQP